MNMKVRTTVLLLLAAAVLHTSWARERVREERGERDGRFGGGGF